MKTPNRRIGVFTPVLCGQGQNAVVSRQCSLRILETTGQVSRGDDQRMPCLAMRCVVSDVKRLRSRSASQSGPRAGRWAPMRCDPPIYYRSCGEAVVSSRP